MCKRNLLQLFVLIPYILISPVVFLESYSLLLTLQDFLPLSSSTISFPIFVGEKKDMNVQFPSQRPPPTRFLSLCRADLGRKNKILRYSFPYASSKRSIHLPLQTSPILMSVSRSVPLQIAGRGLPLKEIFHRDLCPRVCHDLVFKVDSYR